MHSALDILSPTIPNMIRTDHTHVRLLFHQLETSASPKKKQALVTTACLPLEIHAQLEEKISYPALRALDRDRATLDKSVSQHDEMRRPITRLRGLPPTDRT